MVTYLFACLFICLQTEVKNTSPPQQSMSHIILSAIILSGIVNVYIVSQRDWVRKQQKWHCHFNYAAGIRIDIGIISYSSITCDIMWGTYMSHIYLMDISTMDIYIFDVPHIYVYIIYVYHTMNLSIKLVLVGDSATGKTAINQKLLTGQFEPNNHKGTINYIFWLYEI